MDNYIVAMNGKKTAARILGIDTPNVRFFYNKNLDQRRINSLFLKEVCIYVKKVDTLSKNF